jgi:hypothetical protein
MAPFPTPVDTALVRRPSEVPGRLGQLSVEAGPEHARIVGSRPPTRAPPWLRVLECPDRSVYLGFRLGGALPVDSVPASDTERPEIDRGDM